MRKMLTSKLKSNESLFLAANRSTSLCAYTLLKANWLPAPSHPTTPPPAGAALLLSIPAAGLWMGGEQFLPHHEHFPRGKSVELLLSQNSVPSPWKRKITMGSCSFSKLASQKRLFGTVSVGFNRLFHICNDIWSNLSPFVSRQVGFSSSSFTNKHISLFPQKVLIPRGRERETEYKIGVQENSNWCFEDWECGGDKSKGTNLYWWRRTTT